LTRLVLPRRGVFSWQAEGEHHLAEPGSMLVLTMDQPYRFGHPSNGGDDCLRISVSNQVWPELLESVGLALGWIRTTRLPLSGPQRYRNAVFARAAQRLAAEPTAAEELALLRVRMLLAELPGAASPRYRSGRSARARRKLAEEAAGFVASCYTERVAGILQPAAAELHCSPYHLARVFHAEVGVTLHEFRERLRFADALRMLCDGGGGLAALAQRLGYASHSHFTAAFRRTCGATPREAQTLLRRAGPDELRKILTA
jgi:AraC family transcriptional regulator